MISIIEKHTFLELMECETLPAARRRALSDSCCWFMESEGEASTTDDEAGRPAGTSWSDESSDDEVEVVEEASQAAVAVAMPPGVFVQPRAQFRKPALQQKFGSTESRSTVVLRNLPSSFRQKDLVAFLDSQGFGGMYNFIYLPMHFATGSNLGYAFVNLQDAETAVAAREQLEGFRSWSNGACQKVLAVCWSDPHQGLDKLVAHFRNSRVMHGSVPEEYQPMLLEAGQRVPFPRPTKRLRAPC
jgi:hypothetical protein